MFVFEMVLFDVIMTISGHLRISMAISGYPPAILGFLGYLGLSQAIFDYFGCLGTLLSQVISTYLRLS